MKRENEKQKKNRENLPDSGHSAERPYKIIMWACALITAVALAATASFAWLVTPDTGEKTVDGNVATVKYAIDNPANLFVGWWELVGDDYVSPEPPEETVAATSATLNVTYGGVTTKLSDVKTDGSVTEPVKAEYSLTAECRPRLSVSFDPADATNRVTYETGNASSVEVGTEGGLLCPIGEAGETAVITVKIFSADGSAVVATFALTVTIVENMSGKQDEWTASLPGGQDMLKNDLTLLNSSNIPTKTRVKLSWEYGFLDDTENGGDTGADGTKPYTLDELGIVSSETAEKSGVSFSSVSAPFKLTLADGWQFLSPEWENTTFSLTVGEDGVDKQSWTIDSLELTTAQAELIKSNIASGTPVNLELNEKNIISAHIYAVYTGEKTDASVAATGDYGEPIAAASYDSATKKITATEITVATGLVTQANYAGFGEAKNKVTVSLLVQSRQANFYDETQWFDVYRYDYSAAATV